MHSNGIRGESNISPLYILKHTMITKEKIEELSLAFLPTVNCFLVSIEVKKNKIINIEIDSESGLNIDSCIALNNSLKEHYGEAIDEFELNVMSPGADEPIKDLRQITKAIDKEMEILTLDDLTITGNLVSVDVANNTFEITSTTKEKIEGKKSKQLVTRNHIFALNNIKKATRTISFK